MTKKNETKYSKYLKGTKVESPTKKSTMKTTKKSSEWTLEELMEMGHLRFIKS